ncbi:hypothetical protein HPP92_013934 [Vanilla planifolia]|uniref:VQ domain-containing protein n=1 Tax=Vanilla planifolia TaxID=51239 RepID=A0A835QZ74_VANPL|nr:hypothetical protein HPP92_013934 [Vanilla planifolia]
MFPHPHKTIICSTSKKTKGKMAPSSSSKAPTTLRVARESFKPRKPDSDDRRSPVIVHLEPAKVIHAEPQEFMSLVQYLTGNRLPPAVKDRPQEVSPSSASAHSVPDINVAYDGGDDESGF